MTRTRPQHKPTIDQPITVDSSVEIPADTTAVFAYLANLEHNPVWNWAVTDTRSLDGAPRRGSRYMQTHSSPRRSKEILEITSFRQSEHLEVTSRVDGTVVLYRYDLFAMSAEKTELRLAVELHSRRRVGRPDLFTERLASVLDINLENLKAAIVENHESTGRSGAA